MRKLLTLLLVLVVVTGMYTNGSANASLEYSVDAAETFCIRWNDFFEQNNIDMYSWYNTVSDQYNTYVDYMYVCFNYGRAEKDYKTDAIPSTSCVGLYYYPDYDMCIFSVAANEMELDLEKVVIYADDAVITPISTMCTYEQWEFEMSLNDLQKILISNSVTIKISKNDNRKSRIVDFTREEYGYLYNMGIVFFSFLQYSNTRYAQFRNEDLLPSGSQPVKKTEDSTGEEYSFRDDYAAIERAAKSLFFVQMFDNNNNYLGTASGFVSFDEHLFVTNQHVIDGASYLRVWDDDDKMYTLDQVVISDKIHDVAVLLFPDGTGYTPLRQNTKDNLKRGQPVVTIGSPRGFQGTVAYGNISAFPKMQQYDNIQCIQITAPTSPGSSGGALLDDNGEVIGITSSTIDEGQNINFAIPIKIVQDLYNQWDKKSFVKLGSEKSWDMMGR